MQMNFYNEEKVFDYFENKIDKDIITIIKRNEWNNINRILSYINEPYDNQLSLCFTILILPYRNYVDFYDLKSLNDNEFRRWFFTQITMDDFIKIISNHCHLNFDLLNELPWLYDNGDIIATCIRQENSFINRFDEYKEFNNRPLFEKGRIMDFVDIPPITIRPCAYFVNRFHKVLTEEEIIYILEKFTKEDWLTVNKDYLKNINSKKINSLIFINELS